MTETRYLRRAAVLGAGVMGAQIAAHLANAEMDVLLYDLAPAEGDPNTVAEKALAGLKKLDPQPLTSPDRLALIRPANYDQHLEHLRGCDLVIEAIAERLDLKTGLYSRIAPYLGDGAILASNTSGLSLKALAKALPPGQRTRFCGMHFFNPPRYMHLVELIPAPDTEVRLLDRLEAFLVTHLGKGVVRARNTPNFIANRIGVFSLTATMHHAAELDLSPDTVDALTGPLIGRPKSATFRTADVVGLDTLVHVVDGSRKLLKDDPWRPILRLPNWLVGLVARGALGQKTQAGVFRKQHGIITVFNPSGHYYRPADTAIDPSVQAIVDDPDWGRRLERLRQSDHPQARLLWAIHRDVFHYSAVMLASIADNARDVDLAMRWGFGWSRGPFEIWQAAGWSRVVEWLREDIRAGRALSDTPLPDWATLVGGVYNRQGAWSPRGVGHYQARSGLPVYRRQLQPETVLGEPGPDTGETLWENDGVRLWRLPQGPAPEMAILSFTSKQHLIGGAVLDGIHESLHRAARDHQALVLWHDAPFSLGANLKEQSSHLAAGDREALGRAVDRFQRTALALRDAPLPVVAAVQGMALGGGWRFRDDCDRVVAALESYVGLVEAGVGLIPAGGGSKEMARRAALAATGDDPFAALRPRFEALAKAQVARGAEQARSLGFLSPADRVVMNPHELLYVALHQAVALAQAGYRVPLPRPIAVAGRDGIANCRMMIINLLDGGFISEHDARVAEALARVLCGGEVDPGTPVSEDWLLGLEREAFLDLVFTEKTQARIQHTLSTGKPLRN